MAPTVETRDRPSPILLACGLLGPLVLVAMALVESATRPGYSAWRHAVSQLALGDLGWMQELAFYSSGLLVLAFAVGLRHALAGGRGATWGPRLTAGIGASLLLAGVFPIQPGLGYPPPGQPVVSALALDVPVHGLVHALAGTLVFAFAGALCFVLAGAGGAAWSRCSILSGAVVAAFYVATGVVTSLDQAGILSPAPGGLLQRIALVTGFGWMALLALRLLRGAPFGRTSGGTGALGRLRRAG